MTTFNLVKFQLIKLFASCRFWLGIALLTLIVMNINNNIPEFCSSLGLNATPWTMPFILSSNVPVNIGIVVVVMLCDAPFTDSNELFCLLRVNRTKWFVSRILYILSVSIIVPIIIFILTFISILPNVIFANEWGDLYYILSQGGGHSSKLHVFLFVDDTILMNYSPLEATLLSSSLLSIGIVTLGMIVFTANIYINRIVGSSIAIFSCFLLSITSGLPQIESLAKLSPMLWCNLKAFHISTISDIVINALAFNLILLFLAYLKFRKADINIFETI